MININIPNYKNLNIEKLVFDLNGTIACDGKLIEGVKEGINKLSDILEVFILTADTFNTAEELLKDLKAEVIIIDSENSSDFKYNFIKKLGSQKVIGVGNGNNDSKMLKEASLGILVIGKEGASKDALLSSDLIVRDINDVFDIILNSKRLKATLRR